jgi:hypothetical protein
MILRRHHQNRLTQTATGADSRRYGLPNDLHDAVNYLNKEELDSLRAATFEETKRRGIQC